MDANITQLATVIFKSKYDEKTIVFILLRRILIQEKPPTSQNNNNNIPVVEASQPP